jgi:glycosyltransferase involved in cell wall biosynthesis
MNGWFGARMTEYRPTVSLVVPAYNAAETLDECLDAIGRQRFKPLEVIVVDDGSTDSTARIARRASVRLVRHARNRGLAAARNTAVRAARGELLAALDSDLVAPPDWLARMVGNFVKGRREIAGCCGKVVERYTRTIADRWRAVHMRLDFGGRRSYKPRWLFCGISLIRREAIVEAGMFDERCRTAYDDVDMSSRLREAGHTLLYDPAAIAYHLKRSRPGNVIRGFWSYWATKNEMQGAYSSLATAARLMAERQMGIAAYRLGVDLRHGRDHLLGLDLMIPLTFCVRDLDDMVRLKTLRPALSRVVQTSLVERFQAACDEMLEPSPPSAMARLAFAGGRLPDRKGGRLDPSASRYVATFDRQLRRVLEELSQSRRRRLVKHLPALLTEAGLRGS